MSRIFLFIFLAALCAQARILLVVDSNYYSYGPEYKSSIDNYINDIINVDKKPADLILWTTGTGTVRDVCYPLWQRLAIEYAAHHHRPATDDDVEGAIFIGNLPIPQFRHFNSSWNDNTKMYDTSFFDLPHDGYFMDVWDQNKDSAYSSDLDMWPWYTNDITVFRGQAYNQFFNFKGDQGSGYNCDSTPKLGDGIADIWISRVMGEFVKIPLGLNFKDQYVIIRDYMNRAHARMTQPANVPPRSFSMSGIASFGFPYPDDALDLDKLGLPFHAVFQNPDNNPANLQGQLQAGPLGNTNYGAYYLAWRGSWLFQNSSNLWSKRVCTRSSLLNHNTNSYVSNLDTLGYEWAGINEHGCPDNMGMNGVAASNSAGFRAMNGNFGSYACARPVCDVNPMGTQFTFYDTKAINGSYIQFCHGDLWTYPVDGSYPWWYSPECTGANAMWKFETPSTSGEYNFYVHYAAGPGLNSKVIYKIEQFPVGKGTAGIKNIAIDTISQQVHINEQTAGNGWELLGRYTLSPAGYDTTYIQMDANGNDDGMQSGNIKGNPFYVDAAMIVGVDGTPTAGFSNTVDNNDPDFSMNPRGDRTYLEFPADGGPSKVPFFLTASCYLNDYNGTSGSAYNNLGNLFAMLYNGLISMGTVNDNYFDSLDTRRYSYLNFVTALKNGDDFGQAYLKQSPALLGGDPQFILLGAGNLKAAAYIPYPGYERSPFNGPHNITDGATLEAEDFDNGNDGVTYHDNDASNNGGAYRTNVGVDIEPCSAGGYDVGWTENGEWMEYTCNVTAGRYDISLYAASPDSGTQLNLYQDDNLLITFDIPNTGGWQTWQQITLKGITLSAGSASVLKLEIAAGGFNIDKLTFAATDPCYGAMGGGSGLHGIPFGLNPPYSAGREYCEATDGDTNTFYDYKQPNGGYTGLDLGSAQVINRIRYYPRNNNLWRTVGGKFQGSNTSSSSGFVDLYTITATQANSWNEVTIPNSTGYRWVRYLSPDGGYGNIAEMEFYSPPPTYTFEAENLSHTSSAIGTNVGENQYVQFNSGAAIGDWMQFTFPSNAQGAYNVTVYYKSNNNRGIFQASIDGNNQGGTCDEYEASPTYAKPFNAGTITFASPTMHTIKFTVTGKNASSSGYALTIDKITFTPTTGVFPDPNKWYKIATKANSSLCLDVSGGNYVNNDTIQLWTKCNINQEFKFKDAGSGCYTITCRADTGYSIDMSGTFANGQKLKLWYTQTYNANQKFKLIAVGNGFYRLESSDLGYSIDDGGAGGTGVKPALYTSDNYNDNQKWAITEVQ